MTRPHAIQLVLLGLAKLVVEITAGSPNQAVPQSRPIGRCLVFPTSNPRSFATHSMRGEYVTRLSPPFHTSSCGRHHMLCTYGHCQRVGGTVCSKSQCLAGHAGPFIRASALFAFMGVENWAIERYTGGKVYQTLLSWVATPGTITGGHYFSYRATLFHVHRATLLHVHRSSQLYLNFSVFNRKCCIFLS